MTMQLIETITVGSGGAASIEFTSIPQDGTDLLVLLSVRPNTTNNGDYALFINNQTTGFNYSQRRLAGNGSSAFTDQQNATDNIAYHMQGASTTNTFHNASFYFHNYTRSIPKSISIDLVSENNASTSRQEMIASLWNQTAAINTITFTRKFSTDGFTANSTASIYKITKA